MGWKSSRVSTDGTHHDHSVDGSPPVPMYEARFDEVLAFHEPGLAPVRRGGEAFHVDPRGKPAYARRFVRTFGFYEGRAAVLGPEGFHHILPDGSDLQPERFAFCGNYQQGRCVYRDMDGRYGHLDLAGRPVYDARYRYAGDYREGAAVVQLDSGLSTHVDERGALVHGRFYRDLDVFHKGFCRAQDDDGWVHADRRGLPVYARRFAAIEPFYNGQSRVLRFDGGLEIIDETGRTLLELRPGRENHDFAALSADLVGHWRTDTLAAAVSLGIFDALPAPASILAATCRMPLDKANRLLRALAELGVVERAEDGSFRVTPKGKYLRSDHPLTLADAAREYAGPLRERWRALAEALVADSFRPEDVFVEAAGSPLRAPGFHRMLESYARHDYAPITSELPIRDRDVVVDAGGGTGALASLVAAKWPSARVSVLELEGVVAVAHASHANAVRFVPANLFDPWPVRADVVLFSRVLHDWDDEDAITLLVRAREALAEGGRVVLLEMILDEQNPGGGLCDLHLLVVTGGRERTQAQFEKILAAAGLRLSDAKKTISLPWILVAVPA